MTGQPKWRVAGASIAGTSHTKNQTPCQDAHLYTELPNGLLVITAADGAGSAPDSAQGSEHSAQALLDFYIQFLNEVPGDVLAWEALLEDGFMFAIQRLHDLAEAVGKPINHFATTLTLAIAGEGWLVTGLIGDGAVVARAADNQLTLALKPQSGEYAGETYFATMENAFEYMQGRVYQLEVSALAVMTDGLARLAFSLPDYTPHPQFFNPLLDFPAQKDDMEEASKELAAFLDGSRVNTRTDDDKTLVLAARNLKVTPLPADSP